MDYLDDMTDIFTVTLNSKKIYLIVHFIVLHLLFF